MAKLDESSAHLPPEKAAGLLTYEQIVELHKQWDRKPGLLGWLCSTSHKDIGLRYIFTALGFFAIAGVLALMMRLQLAAPGLHILSNDKYNQFFSTHGAAMMFLFAVPIMEGFAIYNTPLMVGTRNLAFPRLNAFGYYTYFFGGVMLFGGLLLNTGPDTGWFSYVPLAGPQFAPGKRVDVWAQMISLTEISALVGAVNVITTVFKLRAPGMSLNRIPLLVWANVVASFMIIFAMPAVMLASSLVAMDRLTNVSTHFFNPAEGGDALLYQHLFWFFGHPEVYIIFVPATGFVSEIVGTMARRPVFGYTAIVLSLVSIGFISFGLWVHHMFATPIPRLGQSFFTAASEMIAIPSGIQIFCWIATLWLGRPVWRVPLLFVGAFVLLFVMGGLTGVMLAAVSFDLQVHDTQFVVAHFHYTLIGGSVFPLFGAFYYWFPKWTGRMLSERLGKLNFWLLFIGFNLTFFPLHILGLHGMPRRVYTYHAGPGWGPLNLLATIGAVLIGVSVLVFVFNLIRSYRSGERASNDPWRGDSLMWSTTSPPPTFNFHHLPTVSGSHPMWQQDADSPLIVGTVTSKRQVITTTLLDAKPQHKFDLAGDSIWPFLLSVIVFAFFVAVMFHPAAVPIAMVLGFLVLGAWFWRGNEPRSVQTGYRAHLIPRREDPVTPQFPSAPPTPHNSPVPPPRA